MNLISKQRLIFFFLFCISTTFPVLQGAYKEPAALKTVQQAIHSLSLSTNKATFLDSSRMAAYEKEYADTMIKCAKILYDHARKQLLDALSEIDDRIAYWQYQKDHPWNYFVSKNPLKWVTGPQQTEELANHLDVLKSHQGELYVLLGQLSEQGIVFNKGYKDIFLADYHKGYEWVDSLLDVLVRIKTKEKDYSDIGFIARAQKLQAKLERVEQFKKDLLSDISDTAIPSYIARNWLKSGAIILGLNYGYNTITPQHITSSLTTAQKGFATVINPLTSTLKDVLTPGWKNALEDPSVVIEENRLFQDMAQSYEPKLNIVKKYVNEMGNKYGLQEKAQGVLKSFEDQDYVPYLTFLDDIANSSPVQKSYSPFKRFKETVTESVSDYYRGFALGRELDAIRTAFDAEKYIKDQQKKYEGYALEQQKKYEDQYAAVGKVVLLIPAFVAAAGGYLAYQKLTAKNYSPLRRALVDINSLFVDPSRQLNDEQYGKMIYLVHMLKKRAEIELPLKRNLRLDFIADLDRIESPELNVASKRAVIEDMFKKYSFLGFIQRK